MLNALTYVFSNELRRPLVWQTVSSIPPVIKEEPFRAKPDQSRFRFTTSPYISEEDQQGEDARKATRERTIGNAQDRVLIRRHDLLKANTCGV